MSDLELLDLLDRAKQNNRGPQGEAGIGITEINQADDKSFTVVLSNGRTFPITLPQPRDGIDGQPGRDGERGREGPAGRPGVPGSSITGRQGVPGDPGRDGTSIDTAIVNRDGHLILGLTDGTVIDAGRVVGPPGAGERGPVGLPGADGTDGAAVLSGHERRRPAMARTAITGSTSVRPNMRFSSVTAAPGRSWQPFGFRRGMSEGR